MVDKSMTLSDVLRLDRGTAQIFMEFGMHCLSCPFSLSESIEEAGMVHGVNVDELVDQLNQYLAEKETA